MSVFKNCKNTEVIIHWWWLGKRTERADQLIVKRRILLIVWTNCKSRKKLIVAKFFVTDWRNNGKNITEIIWRNIDCHNIKRLSGINLKVEKTLIVSAERTHIDWLSDFYWLFGVWIYFLNLCSSWMSSWSWPTPCPALPVLAGGLCKGTVPCWLR